MEELRVSESHLSSLFEQSAVGIVETDTAGKLVKANGRFCELLGRSRESILGRHLREFTHPEDVSRNLLLFSAWSLPASRSNWRSAMSGPTARACGAACQPA